MRWSPVKWEAVNTSLKYFEEETLMSRIFPIMDFHTRWEELSEEDFCGDSFDTTVNGYSPWFQTTGNVGEPNFADDADDPNITDDTLLYFQKIVQLCQENDIELSLIKTPDNSWTKGRSNKIEKLASQYHLTFTDYNEPETFSAIQLDSETDWRNWTHLNTYGANKFSEYLANDLMQQGMIKSADHPAELSEVWNQKSVAWEHQYDVSDLQNTTDLPDYLRKLDHSDYLVFMAVQDEAAQALDGEAVKAMKSLGLKGKLKNKIRQSYLAVIYDGGIWERTSKRKLAISSSDLDIGLDYALCSAGYDSGSSCSVIIDGKEYAKQNRGLNIVVYDTINKQVIDSICFDTHEQKGKEGAR